MSEIKIIGNVRFKARENKDNYTESNFVKKVPLSYNDVLELTERLNIELNSVHDLYDAVRKELKLKPIVKASEVKTDKTTVANDSEKMENLKKYLNAKANHKIVIKTETQLLRALIKDGIDENVQDAVCETFKKMLNPAVETTTQNPNDLLSGF